MKNNKDFERVSLKFDHPCYLRVIRDNTESIARRMGFEEDQIFELGMAVDEAYTNAIEHGSNSESGSELEIEFLIYDDRLEVAVKDSGCGFDHACLKIPKHLGTLTSTRGRGLGLINLLSDKFELNSIPGSGTIIKIIKYLAGHRSGKAAQF